MVFGGELQFEDAARAAVTAAGSGFFAAAAAAIPDAGAAAAPAIDLDALRAATGRKGAQFFAPLRAALTGRLHGPELAPLLRAMPLPLVRDRLQTAGRS